MQNPITLLTATASGIAPKQTKTNSSESAGGSFNQLLSKEISSKKNAHKENTAQKLNGKIAEKNLTTKKTLADEPSKTSELLENPPKTDIPAITTTLPDNVQFLTLVENMAQFSSNLPCPPADQYSNELMTLTATEIASELSFEATIASTLPSSADKKYALSIDTPAERATLATESSEIALPASASDVAMTDLTTAKPLPAPLNTLSMSSVEPTRPVFQHVLEHLSNDLNADLKDDINRDNKSDIQNNISSASKTEIQSNIKSDLNTALQTDIKADLKVVPQTDFKLQPSAIVSESDSGITELSPTVQNFSQQMALSSGQITTSSQREHLAPRVGSPLWDQAIGQKIIWMVAGGTQTAELTLNPPDLGPMQVVLTISNEQTNAAFISNQPDVRDALESAMPKLRQMMDEAGLQLSGFSVKSDASSQGNQFSGERSFSPPKNNKIDTSHTLEPTASQSMATRGSSGLGMVDTFA